MQVLAYRWWGGRRHNALTTIAATGDIKVRSTSETLTSLGSWRMGRTSATRHPGPLSGLMPIPKICSFIYGQIASMPIVRWSVAVIDGTCRLQRQQTTTLSICATASSVYRDCMSNLFRRIVGGHILSGGTDGVDTSAAFGGLANTTLLPTNLPDAGLQRIGEYLWVAA